MTHRTQTPAADYITHCAAEITRLANEPFEQDEIHYILDRIGRFAAAIRETRKAQLEEASVTEAADDEYVMSSEAEDRAALRVA